MTDGIIQDVFRQLRKEYDGMPAIQSRLRIAEQALIDMVKTDIQTSWLEFDCDSRSARTILKSLIGDNKQ